MYATYKSFEPDTVDAVYIGSSAVHRFWLAGQAFEEYGITVYPISFPSMGAQTVLPILKEARRFQNPQLFIIDIHPFLENKTPKILQSHGRTAMDVLDFFSPNRLNLILRTQEFMHRLDPENYDIVDLGLFFPFLQDHAMWNENDFAVAENLGQDVSPYLGYQLGKVSVKSVTLKPSSSTDAEIPLAENEGRYFLELISYIEKNNLTVLFVNVPGQSIEQRTGRFNTAARILREHSLEFVSYSSNEFIDANFDREHDFYDQKHVNYYGAVKYTRILSEYLNEHYDLPDRRDDPRLASWKGFSKQLRMEIEALAANN